jgi:hypothetical protein
VDSQGIEESDNMKLSLNEAKLFETGERLHQRIAERFPESGLSELAAALVQLTQESVTRAERIRRPDYRLRAGLVILGLVAVAGVVEYFWASSDPRSALTQLFQFLDATKGAAAYLGILAYSLITLEYYLKRRKALRAIHELRAMAHLIDMHQLNKDPEKAGSPEGPQMPSGRAMTTEEIRHYLHYCTGLLALVSKIGQLYVQDFYDLPTQAAVDQFENLATGLSSKIWQKIMILDRIQSGTGSEAVPATTLPDGKIEAGKPVADHEPGVTRTA